MKNLTAIALSTEKTITYTFGRFLLSLFFLLKTVIYPDKLLFFKEKLSTKLIRRNAYFIISSILITTLTLNIQAQTGYQTGDEIGNFELINAANTINGVDMTVSLEDYNNVKGYILIFTCNQCMYSRNYEDRIIDLHRKYVMKGYPVIAINSNDANRIPQDSYDNMKLRAKEKNYPFAYLHDVSQQVALNFGATYTPQVYVVQKKKGKNIVRYIGAIDDNVYNADLVKENYLVNVVNSLIEGELPKKKIILNTGCTIEWKNKNNPELSTADAIQVKKRKQD